MTELDEWRARTLELAAECERLHEVTAALEVERDELLRQRDGLAKALEAIKEHQCVVAPSAYLLSTTWNIAANALAALSPEGEEK